MSAFCPKCGEEFSPCGEWLSQGEPMFFAMDCPNCEAELEITADVEVWFSAEPIDETSEA